jgi:hypothetical protein
MGLLYIEGLLAAAVVCYVHRAIPRFTATAARRTAAHGLLLLAAHSALLQPYTRARRAAVVCVRYGLRCGPCAGRGDTARQISAWIWTVIREGGFLGPLAILSPVERCVAPSSGCLYASRAHRSSRNGSGLLIYGC